ncbi:receptor accessory protein 5 [Capsaspora owczarzaki ATCC 30864]|uniref:Receptor accessory protein 5 n=1 Tax=Capsaspora owczarzaki (strain ATCC 30864) TaxID=595528 RepID=A0A0D2X1Y1_CAPO3|nr:receptor accessory protein 5 [Capsaspora owczarzaki ATCC 30864]KJE91599.1 receptor accessory protein 5 [Capsaspora owczarzaki ATCC 30864]|eukprot:XP_004349466.1 receptor accessory protein 5 [Capsaspora owczarzaki ATCC 30864]
MGDQVKLYLDKLDAELNKYPFMIRLQDQTKVPKAYLAIGGFLLILLSLSAGLGAQLVCNIVGFVYPAYASFKAIESTNKDDDTQWLTYWVVFAFFSLLEFFSDIILHWLPFYYLMKFVFLVYLMLPTLNGAAQLYQNVIRRFLLQNQADIDHGISKVRGAATSAASSAVQNANKTE